MSRGKLPQQDLKERRCKPKADGVAAGGLAGIAASLLASRTLAGLLFGLQPRDLPTLALALALLTTASLGAALLHALHACRADPLSALRE